MLQVINESDVWKKLVSEAPLPMGFSGEEEEECERLRSWFTELSNEDRLGVVVDHIRKGTRLYWFLQDDPIFSHVYKDLLPMYISPFRFSMDGLNEGLPSCLTFRQFSVLYAIMKNTDCMLRVPMIWSPPEYWYLYQGSRATVREIGKNLPFNGETIDLGTCDLSLGPAKAVMFQDIQNVQDGGPFMIGSKKACRFAMPNDSYRMSAELYDLWPNYWNKFEQLRVKSFIGLKICEAVRLARNRSGSTDVVFESLKMRQEAIVLVPVEGSPAFTLTATQTRVPVPYLDMGAPVMPDASHYARPREMESPACPCGRCGEDPIEDAIQIIGPSNFVEAIVNIPIRLNAEPSQIIGRDKMESTESDRGTVQIGNMALHAEWVVAVNHRLWSSYVQIDAILAKHASNTLYDRTLDDSNIIQFNLSETLWKSFNGGKVPRTFYKFAWLYWTMGLVVLDLYGKYPVGRQKPVDNIRAIEFSGAPWGNMMAMLEAGLISAMTYTMFKGEACSEPIYKGVDRFGNRMTADLLENYMGPTDIKSIAKAIFAERNSRKPQFERGKFDYMTFDIPLHRNSSTAHSGKDYSRENKDRKLREFLDDLPLGKKQAMVEMLGYYSVIANRFLLQGGTLIVKVLEFWDRSIIDALYTLFSGFRTVRIYRNPYSRPASKEVYFVGVGYESGMAQAKDVFYGMCLKMANHVVANLAVNLIRLAQRYGKEFLATRQICCRMELNSLSCVPFIGNMHDYEVPFASAERPSLIDARNLIISVPHTLNDVRVLLTDGYTQEQAEKLLKFYGTVRRVRTAPATAKESLLVLSQDSSVGETWKIDDETVALVSRMTDTTPIQSLLALVKHNGDIVDAIASLNAQY